MKDKKWWNRIDPYLLIGPIGIPIFIWFMWFYGLEIIATIFFSIWSFIVDFLNGPGGWIPEDDLNDPYDSR